MNRQDEVPKRLYVENEEGSGGGFFYEVTDEQLSAFQTLSPLERLTWLENARLFTLMARTPETARRQEALREGKVITGSDSLSEQGSLTANTQPLRPVA